jgi:hypothetical protein
VGIRKEFVLIPYWIQETLNRNKLPMSAALDLGKLREVTSVNDLISFYTLQESFDKLVGAPCVSCLFWAWEENIPMDNTELKKYYNNIVISLSSDPSFRNDIQTRLFDEGAKQDQYKEPFALYDLSPKVTGIVIYPGHFTNKVDKKKQKLIIDAMLKELYVYNTQHEVANLPMFRRYLELLV